MSTTFGIKIPSSFIKNEIETIEIAIRKNNTIVWKNNLINLLKEKTKVYPLDNNAQGVYTIGDIKKLLKINNYDT